MGHGRYLMVCVSFYMITLELYIHHYNLVIRDLALCLFCICIPHFLFTFDAVTLPKP